MENIIDILGKTINRKLHLAKVSHDYSMGQTFFHQAFGAAELAMAMINDWEKEVVIIDKWEREWKPAFEKIMMEV